MLYGKYTALNNNYMVRRIITAQFSSNIFFISRRKFQFGGYMPVTPHILGEKRQTYDDP